jgi:hypothetical protein
MMVDRLAEYERERSPGFGWPALTRSLEERSTLSFMQNSFGQWCASATKWAIEHPEIALTGAITTGVMLGWLIKRR